MENFIGPFELAKMSMLLDSCGKVVISMPPVIKTRGLQFLGLTFRHKSDDGDFLSGTVILTTGSKRTLLC